MTPEQFEHYVATLFSDKGYQTHVSPQSNDWGIDIIATRGKEKIAIQVKMYGGSTRSVNRRMIMELHGASAYQDCTSAVLATDGDVLPDARLVADKLGIAIMKVSKGEKTSPVGVNSNQDPESQAASMPVDGNFPTFDYVWENYFMPLKGKMISNGSLTNTIKSVTWGGITRITSKGKPNKIDIEGIKLAYNALVKKGEITRAYINQQVEKRCSSGIVLILSQIPFIEVLNNPIRLKLKKEI